MDQQLNFDLIRARFDIEEYVQGFGPSHEGADERLIVCRQCGNQKLSVNIRTKFWRCFTCNKFTTDALGAKMTVAGAGGAIGLVRWQEGLSFVEAIQRISELYQKSLGDPGQLPPLRFAEVVQTADLLAHGLPENCVAVGGLLPYLARRQISLEDAQAFGLGWCPSGWLANRLVFPVWEGGKCIYWQARAMWDRHEHSGPAKYRKTLNPPRRSAWHPGEYFGSGEVLLNLEQASKFPEVVLCEGPTSAIRVGRNAIASFGKQCQPQQILRLIKYGVERIVIMWDGPSEKEPQGAWQESLHAARALAPFMDVRLVRLPYGDPGDFSREELARFIASAEPFTHHSLSL